MRGCSWDSSADCITEEEKGRWTLTDVWSDVALDQVTNFLATLFSSLGDSRLDLLGEDLYAVL